mmetsp:Transcript_96973/g.222125  ORF Transcript_96973/g.222125 Transcript_96973/m.222125 type:complete len:389 (-) Transcript_96973:321-1487(-)
MPVTHTGAHASSSAGQSRCRVSLGVAHRRQGVADGWILTTEGLLSRLECLTYRIHLNRAAEAFHRTRAGNCALLCALAAAAGALAPLCRDTPGAGCAGGALLLSGRLHFAWSQRGNAVPHVPRLLIKPHALHCPGVLSVPTRGVTGLPVADLEHALHVGAASLRGGGLGGSIAVARVPRLAPYSSAALACATRLAAGSPFPNLPSADRVVRAILMGDGDHRCRDVLALELILHDSLTVEVRVRISGASVPSLGVENTGNVICHQRHQRAAIALASSGVQLDVVVALPEKVELIPRLHVYIRGGSLKNHHSPRGEICPSPPDQAAKGGNAHNSRHQQLSQRPAGHRPSREHHRHPAVRLRLQRHQLDLVRRLPDDGVHTVVSQPCWRGV